MGKVDEVDGVGKSDGWTEKDSHYVVHHLKY